MDNIVPLSKADIISIIKQCKSSKVKRIKLEGLELEFHETETKPREMSQKKRDQIDENDRKEDLAEQLYKEAEEAWLTEPSPETEQAMMDLHSSKLQGVV
jgi:hypothetical protein